MHRITINHRVKLTVCYFLLMTAWPVWAADGLRVSAGATHLTGDYGSSVDSDIWSYFVGVRYKVRKWTLSATAPYLEISGPQSIIGLDGVPVSRRQGGGVTRSTRQGIGDLVLSAKYLAYYDHGSGVGLSVGTKVKLPTADEAKLLGTGKPDVALLLDPFYVSGDMTWFGTIGYKFYGDPSGSTYDNVWLGRAGLMLKMSSTFSIGASASARQRLTRSSSSKRELLPFAVWKMDKRRTLQVYAIRGFTDSSPDWGAGLQILNEFH